MHSPDIEADDSPCTLAVDLVHGLCWWRHLGLLLVLLLLPLLVGAGGADHDHVDLREGRRGVYE